MLRCKYPLCHLIATDVERILKENVKKTQIKLLQIVQE